jgi:hypothetical protein
VEIGTPSTWASAILWLGINIVRHWSYDNVDETPTRKQHSIIFTTHVSLQEQRQVLQLHQSGSFSFGHNNPCCRKSWTIRLKSVRATNECHAAADLSKCFASFAHANWRKWRRLSSGERTKTDYGDRACDRLWARGLKEHEGTRDNLAR